MKQSILTPGGERKFLVSLGNKLSKGDSEREAERFSEARGAKTCLTRVVNRVKRAAGRLNFINTSLRREKLLGLVL